jgi:anaerobic selenocysteine-containing dehydrogenase
MMDVTRRKFLTLTGAAAGLALLPAEFGELVRAVAQSEQRWPGPGVETWVNSICQLCPGGCGIRVRLLDGWPVKIVGNPEHPINRGGLCPKGEAGLQVLYDPDRIRRPLKRVGARGEGQWQEIGWDEAIATVAGRLGALRDAGRPEGLVVIGGQYRGLTRTLWDRFLAAFGSPNYVSTAVGCDTSDTVLRLTQGVRGHLGYDLENTSYLLSFGVNLLEGSWSPVWQMRAYAHLRQGRPGPRAKIVQADVRFSATVAKADEWLPVRPGTDGALALGIAHVLVRDGLYDRRLVRERASGFDDWTDDQGRRHEGFRTIVLRDYPPAGVARTTGLDESTIVRIAREFGRARPALAIVDRGASRYPNGLTTRWAVHCLNALVGSIDAPGGVLLPREVPLSPLPPLPRDPVAERGRSRPRVDGAGRPEAPLLTSAIDRFPAAIRSRAPYPVAAAFLYYANPVFSQPRALGLPAALREVPFVASFSPFHDESTQAADLVLPDHTFLERWEDDPTPRTIPFAVLGIRQPVRPPLYDTRATADVIFAIAKALGGPVRAAFPWNDAEEVLKTRLEALHGSARGTSATPSFEEFWTALRERGGWWDLPGRGGGTSASRPSAGTFDFLPKALGRVASIPPEPDGDRERFPLVLNVFRPLAFTGGRTANMPYLLEIAGKSARSSWESWIEINPATAARLGIGDGDDVWVESSAGKVKARARLHPGAPPDVVSLPYGLGHRTGGRWAAGLGANPNDVIVPATAPTTGGAYAITRVKLSRA